MARFRALALGATLLVLAGACGLGGGSPTGGPTVRIGSAGFYESALMAEVYAQVLERNGFNVVRQLQLGPRDTTFPSIERGDFDLMPEYVGSLLEFVNQGAGEATADSAATHQRLRDLIGPRGLDVLGYTPAQDKNVMVVRKPTADNLNLTRMSDLAAVQGQLTWGLPAECATNPLCAGALEEYGVDFDTLEVVELGACGNEIVTALNAGGVEIGQLCSTQPDITRFGFVALEDDRQTQPAENIAPIVRTAFLDQVGRDRLAGILDPISAAMTTDMLLQLNLRVGVDQEDFDVVAGDWLEEHDLLP